jgi:serine/threonine protein kinase
LDNCLLLPTDCVIDSYRVVRVVGSGGFGITYEAEDKGLGMRVALERMKM